MTDRSQRWRERREAFVDDATVIDPSRYAVDVIDCMRTAKPFVELHHYSGSFPATRLSCGLFRDGPAGTSELVGVCSFAVPVNNAGVRLRAGLDDHNAAPDLGRLVLLDDVPGNGETWFVARAFRLLRREKPGVIAVTAYSDPYRRKTDDGRIVMPGHVGMVYQGLSARYAGRSSPRFDHIMPDGRIASPRALSKIRTGDTGSAYASRQLVAGGAPERRHGEEPVEWLARLERTGFLSRRRHPGNHVYSFALTRAAKIAARGLPDLAYPRIDRQPAGGDVTSLPLLAA